MRIFFLALLVGFLVSVNARNFNSQMYRRHAHVGSGGNSNGGSSSGFDEGMGHSSQKHVSQRENCKDDGGGGGGGKGGNGGGGGNCGGLLPNDGSPKEKATNIAQKAAAEAKAANDAQNDAANAAAQQVKTQLAEKAAQAAKAAEAAMAGKQQMVEQLQNEIKEAEALRQQEEQAVQNAQNALNNAQAATAAANEQINAINIVAENAKVNLQSWEGVTSNAQQELAEKTQHHEVAKMRIEQLLRNLGSAREDLERTKAAACKAAVAAKKAAENAEQRSPRNFEKRQTWRGGGGGGNAAAAAGLGLGPYQGRLGRRLRKRHRRPQQYLDLRSREPETFF